MPPRGEVGEWLASIRLQRLLVNFRRAKILKIAQVAGLTEEQLEQVLGTDPDRPVSKKDRAKLLDSIKSLRDPAVRAYFTQESVEDLEAAVETHGAPVLRPDLLSATTLMVLQSAADAGFDVNGLVSDLCKSLLSPSAPAPADAVAAVANAASKEQLRRASPHSSGHHHHGRHGRHRKSEVGTSSGAVAGCDNDDDWSSGRTPGSSRRDPGDDSEEGDRGAGDPPVQSRRRSSSAASAAEAGLILKNLSAIRLAEESRLAGGPCLNAPSTGGLSPLTSPTASTSSASSGSSGSRGAGASKRHGEKAASSSTVGSSSQKSRKRRENGGKEGALGSRALRRASGDDGSRPATLAVPGNAATAGSGAVAVTAGSRRRRTGATSPRLSGSSARRSAAASGAQSDGMPSPKASEPPPPASSSSSSPPVSGGRHRTSSRSVPRMVRVFLPHRAAELSVIEFPLPTTPAASPRALTVAEFVTALVGSLGQAEGAAPPTASNAGSPGRWILREVNATTGQQTELSSADSMLGVVERHSQAAHVWMNNDGGPTATTGTDGAMPPLFRLELIDLTRCEQYLSVIRDPHDPLAAVNRQKAGVSGARQCCEWTLFLGPELDVDMALRRIGRFFYMDSMLPKKADLSEGAAAGLGGGGRGTVRSADTLELVLSEVQRSSAHEPDARVLRSTEFLAVAMDRSEGRTRLLVRARAARRASLSATMSTSSLLTPGGLSVDAAGLAMKRPKSPGLGSAAHALQRFGRKLSRTASANSLPVAPDSDSAAPGTNSNSLAASELQGSAAPVTVPNGSDTSSQPASPSTASSVSEIDAQIAALRDEISQPAVGKADFLKKEDAKKKLRTLEDQLAELKAE